MVKSFTPQASIIIPAYNAADTIADQLDALCQQVDAPEFEVIVADNGSTDNLRGAVEPFKQKLNVRVIDASAKKGQSFARNLAVWEAQTNFILSCDADDIVGEHWVNKIYQHISTSDCQVATPTAVFYPHLGETGPHKYSGNIPTEPDISLGYKIFAQTSSTGYRRSTFIEIGGMDETYNRGCEDIDFSWRMVESGRSLVWEQEAVLFYRARNEEKDLFVQFFRYAREDILLWKRLKDRGVHLPTFSFAQVCKRALAVLLRYPKKHTRGDLIDYAKRIGTLSGYVQYRILRQKSKPIFLQESISTISE